MENLGDWKTRLSILWLCHVVGGVSFVVLELFESGDLKQIGGVPVNNPTLLLFMVLLLAPLVMAFLSQTLADKANRWINIIAAAVYFIPTIIALISTLVNPSVLAINPLFGIVWSVLIVWYAYKWPKKEA